MKKYSGSIRKHLWRITAVFGITVAGAAWAIPHKYIHTVYYSSAAKTHVVGSKTLHCSGNVSKTGHQTGFSKTTTSSCN